MMVNVGADETTNDGEMEGFPERPDLQSYWSNVILGLLIENCPLKFSPWHNKIVSPGFILDKANDKVVGWFGSSPLFVSFPFEEDTWKVVARTLEQKINGNMFEMIKK